MGDLGGMRRHTHHTEMRSGTDWIPGGCGGDDESHTSHSNEVMDGLDPRGLLGEGLVTHLQQQGSRGRG